MASRRSKVCPRCGRNDIRLAGRHGVRDRLLACIGLAPYRCGACRNRFFRFPIGNGNESFSAEPAPTPSLPLVAKHPLTLIPIAYSLLIVSHDPAIRRLLCKLLRKPGFHTHQLGDAAQLPSELQARKVDVLIIDLDEPEQPGFEKVASLRSKCPNLMIIALSAFPVASVPGSIVLPKPFRREQLLESVQNALVEAARSRLPNASTTT
jgi:CheY-like chemotaxis protein